MLEQKLDRIIELLEAIANNQQPKRKGRATMNEPKETIMRFMDELRGKQLTFDEVCKILGIESTRKNQIKYGSAITDLGIIQKRTKSRRYYQF